jgi:hypothetical protein
VVVERISGAERRQRRGSGPPPGAGPPPSEAGPPATRRGEESPMDRTEVPEETPVGAPG